jgi:hypothetical protein
MRHEQVLERVLDATAMRVLALTGLELTADEVGPL